MERCASCGLDVAESAVVCEGCGAAMARGPNPAARPADDPSFDVPDDPPFTVPDEQPLAVLDAAGPLAAGPHGPVPAAGGSRFTPREVFTAAAAVMAAGVLTFALLMTRGAEETAAASTAPAGPPPASGAAPPVPSTFNNAWNTANVARWVASSRTFAIELTAENRVAVWQRTVTPVLVVRCRARRPEVFVFTDSPARIEPKTDAHTVQLAFDGEPALAERWPDAADHDALFAPDGAAFLTRMTGARSLAFGFTPHNAAPVVVHFNVAGLAPHLEAARECGWMPGR